MHAVAPVVESLPLPVDAAQAAADLSCVASAPASSVASAAMPPLALYWPPDLLLLAVDDERGGFLINDPARNDERTFVHANALEAARHADGTDEDLLLIPIYQDAPIAAPAPGSESRIQALTKAPPCVDAERADSDASVHSASSVTLR